MEWLKQMSLKKTFFFLTMLFLIVAIIFSILLMLCISNVLQQYGSSIEIKIDNNGIIQPTDTITTNNDNVFPMWYNILVILRFALPIFFVTAGLLSADILFYRLKLKKPLAELQIGAEKIMQNDLDFSIHSISKDELGQLCNAFEKMRLELLKSNRELWRQMEERKRLNAAFSHDLRNPVTVLKGSVKILKKAFLDDINDIKNDAQFSYSAQPGTQYGRRYDTRHDMQYNARRGTKYGVQYDTQYDIQYNTRCDTQQDIQYSAEYDTQYGPQFDKQYRMQYDAQTLQNIRDSILLIEEYAGRIEKYIEAMSSIQRLEELQCCPDNISFEALIKELSDSTRLLAMDSGIKAQIEANDKSENSEKNLWLDKAIVFNVAENLITNALRFAKTKIQVSLKLDDEMLALSVQDDGPGFPRAILQKGAEPFLRGNEDNEQGFHFGMGLYICRLLCEKHNGSLIIQNNPVGALVTAIFKISKLKKFSET